MSRARAQLSPGLFVFLIYLIATMHGESLLSNSQVRCISLGLFILDTFEWRDSSTGQITKHEESIIGGGGTYAILGSRCWLRADQLCLIVDRGSDWDERVQRELEAFGKDMWLFRNNPEKPTTRALNLYTGQHRGRTP